MRCLAAGLARSGCKQPSQKSSSLRSSHRSSLRSFATTFLALGLRPHGRFASKAPRKSSSLRSSHRSSLRSFATTFLALGLRPHGRFASKAPRKTLLRSSLRSSLSRGDYHYLRAEVNCNSIRSSLRSSLIELHSKYIKETIVVLQRSSLRSSL